MLAAGLQLAHHSVEGPAGILRPHEALEIELLHRTHSPWESSPMQGYDVIGDVHGCADKLE
jgi:hypothetical protein